MDTLIHAISRENIDLEFVNEIFQNIDWKNEDESTGVPSLLKTAINEARVMTPQYDEQRVLGAYFVLLDHLINLHQHKLEKMKALKSAYLSDMFPAEGERRPKRRFKGFTDDWEQHKLEKIALEKT